MTRNVAGLVGAAALYLAIAYGLHLFEPKGRTALVVLVAFHVGFGLLGYFIFSGRTSLRAACVLLVIVGFGLGLEYYRPDPGHQYVQIFVMTAFGVLAAICTYAGRYLETMLSRG